uniref:OFD1 centriole and centriolar satellite protein n=1 Tax=Salmo trutta TaxID=8032 RepID=A0A673XBT2_SALTR
MSVAKEEALSPDELRKRLYQTFKNRGVLDTLKTQLRNQLIHELKHPILSGETVPRPVPMKSDSVLVTASNSLVVDHLRNSGYEYTLSVFYPECGMCKDKIFTSTDLLQLMKISPRSPLYKSLVITSSCILACPLLMFLPGFLMSLLIELTDHHLHGEQRDADTQTTTTPAYRESLVDKMKMIDEEYEALRYKGDKWVSYESKLAAYRKEVEAQVQAEMNAKLQHYKDVEISKVKMEEKDKSRKEILQLRQDMERTYEMKSGALINREKNAIDRLQKQQEIEEKDVYMQRQAVLKEIETVRNREAELRLRMEAFEKTCKIQEDKTKTMEELLRRRELAVKTMEDTYDQKLKNELSRYQLELNEDYTKRTEKLTENEKRNKVETIRMQKESAAIDAKLEEHSRACAELRRLQMELDTSQSQYSLLTQQNELLRERLETMNDYPTLRRERVEQQAQLRLLKKQLEEAQEENQHLGRPSVEQLALQTELRRLESARRLSEEEFDSHRQVLQAQLHNEVTLENEVLRNPKPSLVDRSVLELSPDKLVPPDIYVDRGVLRAWVAGYDDVCEAGVMPSRGRSSSPDSDTELVAGAKARIRELEKEAETLEEAYRNYQQRAVHATVSHMLPPRCLSPQRAPVSPRPHSTQRQHISHQRPRSPQRQQVPPHPCPHSPQHPQVSHRPLSPQRQPPPQRARDPTSPQPRVTFAEDQSQDQYPGPGSGRDFQSLDFSEARFSGDRCPQEGSSSPPRRLSSTPLSLSRRQLHTEPVEGRSVQSVLVGSFTSNGFNVPSALLLRL